MLQGLPLGLGCFLRHSSSGYFFGKSLVYPALSHSVLQPRGGGVRTRYVPGQEVLLALTVNAAGFQGPEGEMQNRMNAFFQSPFVLCSN